MWFLEINRTRQFEGISGLHQAIPYREIEAWSRLSAQPIAAHEFRLLRKLDELFVREERLAASKKAKTQESRKPKRKGSHAFG